MDGSLILETTFLIDLERERNREARGPAVAFLVRLETIADPSTPMPQVLACAEALRARE